jgi:hypothetical protein
MKHLKLILGASLVSVMMAAFAADQSSPPSYKFEVTLSGGEAKMRCVTGCYWVTTSYSCGPAKSCTFTVDQNGVQGSP